MWKTAQNNISKHEFRFLVLTFIPGSSLKSISTLCPTSLDQFSSSDSTFLSSSPTLRSNPQSLIPMNQSKTPHHASEA